MIKMSVSIFGQTTGYMIYTVRRDPVPSNISVYVPVNLNYKLLKQIAVKS